MRIVDFRSSTVALPTPEMRRAMAEAELGDAGRGEDPTVNRLEAMAAERLGKEAGLLVLSGIMGNLVSILTHAQRGDEIIVGTKSHIVNSEAGGASALGGVAYHTVPEDQYGMMDPDQVEEAIRLRTNINHPRTAMIALENVHNGCGGWPLTADYTKTIVDMAHRHELPVHIDGSCIFNAEVSLETPVAELVQGADSVAFCLSKGLACPIGSVICGSHEFIDRARRALLMVGGQMRQAGIIAAAGIVALESMVERLAEDHANARRLAQGLAKVPGITVENESPPTNLVFLQVGGVDPVLMTRKLEERGVKGGRPVRRWYFVTHYGITSDDVDYALDVIEDTFREYAKA